MDFLAVLDPAGKVLCRARNRSRRGDDLSANPVIAAVLKTKAPARGTIILSAESLAVEGQELAARARIPLVDTPAARPTTDALRSDGMVLAVAVPVLDCQGRLLAVLYAGDLLSRRHQIVDAIKREVFLQHGLRGPRHRRRDDFPGRSPHRTSLTFADGSARSGPGSAPPWATRCWSAAAPGPPPPWSSTIGTSPPPSRFAIPPGSHRGPLRGHAPGAVRSTGSA